MHDLAEIIEKSKEIKELKEKLTECLKSEMSVRGMDCVDTHEAGEVVDMIKDLAETEKYCMEALYFQKVVEAMTSYDEPRYGESMGYNSNRYANGMYAPSGTGNRTSMGYMMPMPTDGMPDMSWDGAYGYTGTGSNSGNSGSGRSGGNNGDGSSSSSNSGRSGYFMPDGGTWDETPYGRAYNEYKRRRKYYTTTNSPEDKREMELNAEEHVNMVIATMRDIWKDADTPLKKRMKDGLTELMKDMTV